MEEKFIENTLIAIIATNVTAIIIRGSLFLGIIFSILKAAVKTSRLTAIFIPLNALAIILFSKILSKKREII